MKRAEETLRKAVELTGKDEVALQLPDPPRLRRSRPHPLQLRTQRRSRDLSRQGARAAEQDHGADAAERRSDCGRCRSRRCCRHRRARLPRRRTKLRPCFPPTPIRSRRSMLRRSPAPISLPSSAPLPNPGEAPASILGESLNDLATPKPSGTVRRGAHSFPASRTLESRHARPGQEPRSVRLQSRITIRKRSAASRALCRRSPPTRRSAPCSACPTSPPTSSPSREDLRTARRPRHAGLHRRLCLGDLACAHRRHEAGIRGPHPIRLPSTVRTISSFSSASSGPRSATTAALSTSSTAPRKPIRRS